VDDQNKSFGASLVGWNAILERIAGGKQVSSLRQLFDFQDTKTIIEYFNKNYFTKLLLRQYQNLAFPTPPWPSPRGGNAVSQQVAVDRQKDELKQLPDFQCAKTLTIA
jgi:hypothetical protein